MPRSLTTSEVVRLRADPAGLAQDLARPMPRRPSEAARRGTRFHAWVQDMFADRPLIAVDDLDAGGTPPDAELDRLKVAFERSEYAGIRPHRVEAPFQLLAGGHLIRGRIDAVYRAGSLPSGAGAPAGAAVGVNTGYDQSAGAPAGAAWEVIDYKTGRRPRDSAAADLQLAIYRLAWAGIAGVALEQVSAGFLYVATGQVVRPAGLPDLAGIIALLDRAGAPGATPSHQQEDTPRLPAG